ncbi:hypothetical Protein YC6258_04583 [Gynuella sunshinyii YC6258]|uniref:Uncharacterized protein n=1 Tax=Gynuella sunshinyii YC6258 TaxID=1445510 RepID=A0A0C5VB94_9GAMM|nr:hypothetical Protein YC6258_04583 [Gynuella sunshinyii YC6258]
MERSQFSVLCSLLTLSRDFFQNNRIPMRFFSLLCYYF